MQTLAIKKRAFYTLGIITVLLLLYKLGPVLNGANSTAIVTAKPKVKTPVIIEDTIQKVVETVPAKIDSTALVAVAKEPVKEPVKEKVKKIIKKPQLKENFKSIKEITEETIIETPVDTGEVVTKIEEGRIYKGMGTYYHDKFHGRKTANGDIYDKNKYTAAIRMNAVSLPYGTIVEVFNKRRNRTVLVKVNDRMSDKTSAIIDLSYAAAKELGIISRGRANITFRIVTPEEMEIIEEETITN